MMTTRKKVGLALGSGGARGLAHIGIIKVLEQYNIPIDYIAGTSIGALIGAAYASTKDINQIEDIFLDTNWKRIIKFSSDLTLFSGGLIDGKYIKKFAKSKLDIVDSFDLLQIPFAISTTNIQTGENEIIKTGKLIEAIRASISFPGIFKPVNIKNKMLVDGGLTNPVPTNIIKQMGADIIIAVDLEPRTFSSTIKKANGKNLINNLISSVHIMQKSIADFSCQYADLVIAPKNDDVLWIQFHKTSSLITAGEIAAKKNIIKIKKLLGELKK